MDMRKKAIKELMEVVAGKAVAKFKNERNFGRDVEIEVDTHDEAQTNEDNFDMFSVKVTFTTNLVKKDTTRGIIKTVAVIGSTEVEEISSMLDEFAGDSEDIDKNIGDFLDDLTEEMSNALLKALRKMQQNLLKQEGWYEIMFNDAKNTTLYVSDYAMVEGQQFVKCYAEDQEILVNKDHVKFITVIK